MNRETTINYLIYSINSNRAPKTPRTKTIKMLFQSFLQNPLDKRVRRVVKFYTTLFTTEQHDEMDKAEILMLLDLIKLYPHAEMPRRKLKKFEHMLPVNNIENISLHNVSRISTILKSLAL